MTATEAYRRFLIKSEGNSTNDTVAVSRDRFVELMNESYIKFVEYIYEKKNSDELRYIQGLLVEDKYVSNIATKTPHSTSFYLPDDYLNFSSVWGSATNGECSGVPMTLFEIKDLDRSEIINDEFNSPSFKYREAPFNFTDNRLRVFTKDFNMDGIYLSYYRYPVKLRQTDLYDLESPLDDSYELDLDDKAINRIISLAVKEMDINTSNERFQINQLRAQSKL